MISYLIAGAIATALILVFLLYYAIGVRSVPLLVIIVGVLLMVCWNFYEEATKGKNNNKS